MAGVSALESVFGGRGLAAAQTLVRTRISAVEHETVPVPQELVKPDGSLDLYHEVGKLFQPTYQNGRPSIQCSRWVGFIPLNDAYALEVSTRVPVGNLERLVGMAAGYEPRVLQKYTRFFGRAETRPEALFDLLTDQLLNAFDRIWDAGLLKTYRREVHTGSSPVGRVMPFETAWLTAKSGRPTALSSAFQRTTDFGPNRLLRHAFEKLLVRYVGIREQNQRPRTLRLRKALLRLEDVGRPAPQELTQEAIAGYLRALPVHHEHYADALMVAHLIAFDLGLSIRRGGTIATLPSILIDMETVFERSIRKVLSDGLADDPGIVVKDGNTGGEGGAKLPLFDPVREGLKNSPATPDIVIERNGSAALVIDAKYKPAPDVPDRRDINQVIVYGARYGTGKVMVLHADRPAERPPVELCGSIGHFAVYNGMVDLNADPVEDEEAALVSGVRALL